MGGKIKKTRPELLKQRRDLARYERFLPTLVLKKQQLQTEILKVRTEVNRLSAEADASLSEINPWVALFSESLPGPITRLATVKRVITGERNVAGAVLPVLKYIDYEEKPYSFFASPPWVDSGIRVMKKLLELRETIRVTLEQERLLHVELKKVTQRVNLFEKVMIPSARENIRVIRIQLAEEETAAVGRAKIAKAKSGVEANRTSEAGL